VDADEQARRNLAIEVRNAAHVGAAGVANGTTDPAQVATAASAVVLASDLEAAGRYEVGYGNGESSVTADASTLCDQLDIDVEGHPFDAIRQEVTRLRASGECCCVRRDGQVMEVANPAERREHGVRVGSCRQGWRARLANIERLLSSAYEEIDANEMSRLIDQALAEVRAMLDNPAGREG
jgi:hypothetical protein